MRILIISQFFAPEQFLINDLAKTLRDLGHQIVVATGKPNYPEGKIFDGYVAAGVQRELFNGDIPVVRVPLRARGKGGAINLFLNYASFAWSGSVRFPGLFRNDNFDVIFVYGVSPIIQAIPAIILSRIKKTHLAIWIQDLWPESLAATGFIRSRVVLNAVGLLVRWIYSCADTLLVQSRAFIGPVSRYTSSAEIVYYPNTQMLPTDAENNTQAVPEALLKLLRDRFCVVFAGNIGTAQAVETLIAAAGELKGLSDVRIVLVGSGSMLEWARAEKAARSLDNVVFSGRLPSSAMPTIYRHASCLLVSLKDTEIFGYTIPSKIQSYMAAGRPIIAALNGEGARVVGEAGAGLTCPAEDPAALADRVKELYRMPEEARLRMGAAGRMYFLSHYEMRSQALRLTEIIKQRIARTTRTSS